MVGVRISRLSGLGLSPASLYPGEYSIVQKKPNSEWEWVQNGYRKVANGMLTEQEQNRTDRERNWYRNDKEHEHMGNSNKMHPVKCSLLGFFWLVLYLILDINVMVNI